MSETKMKTTGNIGKIRMHSDSVHSDRLENLLEFLKVTTISLPQITQSDEWFEILCLHPAFDNITVVSIADIPTYSFIHRKTPENKLIFQRVERN